MLRWKAELLLIPGEILANEAWCTPPAVHLLYITHPPPFSTCVWFQLSYAWLSKGAGLGTDSVIYMHDVRYKMQEGII